MRSIYRANKAQSKTEYLATREEFDFAYSPGLPAPLIRDRAALPGAR